MKRRDFFVSMAGVAALGAFGLRGEAAVKSSKFKYGVADWSLGLAGNPKSFDAAKSIGLDGVQVSSKKRLIAAPFFDAEEVSAFKAAFARTGLAVASVGMSGMNEHPFRSADGTVPCLISAIDSAAEMNCRNILLPFFGKANLRVDSSPNIDEKYFAEVVARLKEAAPHAQAKNVHISLENTLSAADNLRVLDAVGSPNVDVYFDIMNAQYYGHDTLQCLKALKGRIGQIHLKDIGHFFDMHSGVPRDIDACLRTIPEIGYDGWLVFELHGFKPSRDGTPEAAVRRNLEYVKKLLG